MPELSSPGLVRLTDSFHDGLALSEDDGGPPIWPKLNGDSNQVRLLDILPAATDDDEIECRYSVRDLDEENLEYETLSYAWGTDTAARTIKVDGRERLVGANLYAALSQLRRIRRSRTGTTAEEEKPCLRIWVDAICIHQSDNEEKTRQVNMMGRIYSESALCNIWIGDFSSDETPLTAVQVQAGFDLIGLLGSPKQARECPPNLATLAQRLAAAQAIKIMMDAPWWTRIWTVQEAALSRKAEIVWGSLSLPWDLLEKGSVVTVVRNGLGQLPFNLWECFHEAADPYSMRTGSVRIARRRRERPLDVLWRFRHRLATNPLDKVYGLMGIMPAAQAPNGRVFSSIPSCDYALEPATLYKRVTLDLIELDKGLMPLIGRRGERGVTKGLPTWSVDWMQLYDEPRRHYAHYWAHRYVYYRFQADAGVPMQLSVSSPDKSVLGVGGVLVDRVAAVGSAVLNANDGQPAPTRDVGHNIRRWEGIAAEFFDTSDSADAAKTRSHPVGDRPWRDRFHDLVQGRFPEVGDLSGATESGWQFDMCRTQCLLITEMGHLALGPVTSQIRDEIWILFGGRIPFLLRPIDTAGERPSVKASTLRDEFEFVGDTFVHGLMNGGEVKGRGKEDHRTVYLH